MVPGCALGNVKMPDYGIGLPERMSQAGFGIRSS
jgi:hypothetical protein